MSNDVEQRLSALNEGELRDVLSRLVYALHEENTNQCYALLRDWGLENVLAELPDGEGVPSTFNPQTRLNAIDNRNRATMDLITELLPVRMEEAEIKHIEETTHWRHVGSYGVMIVWELERPTSLVPFVVQSRKTRAVLEEFEEEEDAVQWATANKDG
jgi:hypothetical protein